MNWFNILIYSAASGASQSAARKARQKAGQNDEQEGSWVGGCVGGCLGWIVLIVVGIVAFNVWREGISSTCAHYVEVMRPGPSRRAASVGTGD
jgi:hypothetical protein